MKKKPPSIFPSPLILRELKPRASARGYIKNLRAKEDAAGFIPRRFIFLTLIFAFSLFLHLFRLNTPQTFMFDEVYHAFTAQEMTQGNQAAWEWWTVPPPGFAYEWTHPHLAKYGMILGMQLFGQNPFGWRFIGALLGASTTLLIFLIANRLFNQKTALLSALLFNLALLPLVMARIAMNDIYFLFFMLLTLSLFLYRKWFLTPIALGLSLASKWTSFYLYPLLIFLFLLQAKKTKLEANQLLRLLLFATFFILIPVLVYLYSYLPFFQAGHSWSQLIELQKQIWWYHTRLRATHNYSSPWWSWPLLLRPVWFYVNYQPLTTANIYAFANPFLIWLGLLAILYQLSRLITRLIRQGYRQLTQNQPLIITFAAYAAFWLPWAFSPRIMFFYHYLPALPFLTLLLSQTLVEVFQSRKLLLQALGLVAFISIIFGFFFFYPLVTALPLPNRLLPYFFWLKSWK